MVTADQQSPVPVTVSALGPGQCSHLETLHLWRRYYTPPPIPIRPQLSVTRKFAFLGIFDPLKSPIKSDQRKKKVRKTDYPKVAILRRYFSPFLAQKMLFLMGEPHIKFVVPFLPRGL